MQEPDAVAPSPKVKKKDRGSPSGSLLEHRSKMTVRGPRPWGGSGVTFSTAFGAWLTLGSVVVVVVVVTVARVVVVLTLEAMVVVVVSLLLLLTTMAVVPATAAPAPTIPTTAAVPMPPPTNPAGTEGNTATVALFRNGATGTFFLHSCAERTTIGAYSAVRDGMKALSCASR